MICTFAKTLIDIKYHNEVYGKRVYDDNLLFKALSLEIFQVGLSWNTVLKKEKSLDAAFYNFNIEKVSKMTESDVIRLLDNKEIIRHRKKIEAIINNAKVILKLQEEKSFVAYIYALKIDEKYVLKQLKSLGFKFIGLITIKCFLESVGILNGHESECDFKNNR